MMWTLGPIGFTAPWLLVALAALPILWVLLRAVPPAPIRRRFPGVALLLGLADEDSQSDRTPWWLLLLRLLAVAAVIVGFAGPVLNPQAARDGKGDLVIALDGTWAGAANWQARMDRVNALLTEAALADRRVAVVALTDLPSDTLPFTAPNEWQNRLPNLQPKPWQPQDAADYFSAQQGSFETYWLSDGVDFEGRDTLLEALEAAGSVTVFQTPQLTIGVRPARFEDGQVIVSATRTPVGAAYETQITAVGLDPAGVERQLATVPLAFEAGDADAETAMVLPPELRNRITRFEITGNRSAGAVSLTDDALKRREVALIAGSDSREGLELLSPLYYLREALEPTADLIDGTLSDILLANPDVVVLADVATLSETETDAVHDWVENGGMLLRFAGPRLAASDLGRNQEDPLLPVRLRSGGRTVGGAMSWGEPKTLAPFENDSPFFGLPIPEDVNVTSQVMAQPDPTLADRVIAQLADGTPLVTRKITGEGQVVLVHVTANAEWSSLPLSGLFVQMLERLAVSTRPATPDATELAGTTWLPNKVLDAYGRLEDGSALPGVAGEMLATAAPGPLLQPGLYAGNDRQLAVNVIGSETLLSVANWPARIAVEGMATMRETALKGWLLSAAILLLLIDVIASLAVGGRLRGPRADVAALLALMMFSAPDAQAQTDDAFALRATSQVVLGHVITGNAQADEIAEAGLLGLSQTLFRRTSIEPSAPIGVDLETDELAFFPFLYWPITADQPLPSHDAYAKLNRYLRAGGMIMFDTRDADTARFGSGSPEGRKLQAIARSLDIPALEPVPSDHVLTRTFYLLQDFSGRYASRDVWVEAAPIGATQIEGMPFRNLNDGVTPVIIGGNNWAAAWAVNANGSPMLPVGRGMAGERQREIALRFGVNVIMHVLTGNYKSDQVHVPDLLDRLGQ
ncbi:putative membrane protein (TIGR02226 family) [Yoonia maritima]|uniref:Putative membrane protein (TIGR02226 family) n=2 Tax=Yoonia maritima TaxID=1435347 RepID=A0A2T0VZX3_9RHOB|nr:putative membrane protein (TIGR02226 family) [Yoonia maritima]